MSPHFLELFGQAIREQSQRQSAHKSAGETSKTQVYDAAATDTWPLP
jgi:hypothetical protein